MNNTSLSFTTKVLHITIALTIVCLLVVGFFMQKFEVYALYPIHKSVGALILILAITRVVWRMKEGWPEPVGQASAIQHFIAKVVHWVLIVSTLLFPISGIMGSIGGGHGLSIFGLEIAAPLVDAVTGKTIPVNEAIADLGHGIHGLLFWIVSAALILHVIGALKHHIVDKDDTLNRMFSFKRK